jgi:hypothetical protein
MEAFKEICSLCKNSVSIEVNPHRDFYESVESYMEDRQSEIQKMEQGVYQKMIDTDTIVWVQAYPNGATSFYCSYHYDIDLAINEILTSIKS